MQKNDGDVMVVVGGGVKKNCSGGQEGELKEEGEGEECVL